MVTYSDAVLDHARAWTNRQVSYEFTRDEAEVLTQFFTNLNRHTFFMHSLPANVGATLLAMYSRMKNPRGIRGVFVDAFLPEFLASTLDTVQERFEGDARQFMRTYQLSSLAAFIEHSEETRIVFREFVGSLMRHVPYLEQLADSRRTRAFLTRWLDAYGHNSIARMAGLWLCCENISILAAKSIEWNRPGSGFIELSTRYVDMNGKDRYPIEEELSIGYGIKKLPVFGALNDAFRFYGDLTGEDFDGTFPKFLRERYEDVLADVPNGLEAGVIGETCDVLGNLLPAATLTSVAVHVSGEAFSMLLKHLLLDNMPETIVLAEAIRREAVKVGGHQFAAHAEPTEWDRANWAYLNPQNVSGLMPSISLDPQCKKLMRESADTLIEAALGLSGRTIGQILDTPRGEFDKLPREFEVATAAFIGTMSFRGWRDLHRQGMSTHKRTLLTPLLGFYTYPKPHPEELRDAFCMMHGANVSLFEDLRAVGVPDALCQYPLSLGNLVGFTFYANLRQLEFCTWQRTKFSVNDEVRQAFLAMDHEMRVALPIWLKLSRADRTSRYIFARGKKGIPLTHSME